MTETFGETAAVGALNGFSSRLVIGLVSDLDVATEVGRVGFGLGKFTVEPDGVVSGQLGQSAEDCVAGETGK
jgi:hypothetical protein